MTMEGGGMHEIKFTVSEYLKWYLTINLFELHWVISTCTVYHGFLF